MYCMIPDPFPAQRLGKGLGYARLGGGGGGIRLELSCGVKYHS